MPLFLCAGSTSIMDAMPTDGEPAPPGTSSGHSYSPREATVPTLARGPPILSASSILGPTYGRILNLLVHLACGLQGACANLWLLHLKRRHADYDDIPARNLGKESGDLVKFQPSYAEVRMQGSINRAAQERRGPPEHAEGARNCTGGPLLLAQPPR